MKSKLFSILREASVADQVASGTLDVTSSEHRDVILDAYRNEQRQARPSDAGRLVKSIRFANGLSRDLREGTLESQRAEVLRACTATGVAADLLDESGELVARCEWLATVHRGELEFFSWGFTERNIPSEAQQEPSAGVPGVDGELVPTRCTPGRMSI